MWDVTKTACCDGTSQPGWRNGGISWMKKGDQPALETDGESYWGLSWSRRISGFTCLHIPSSGKMEFTWLVMREHLANLPYLVTLASNVHLWWGEEADLPILEVVDFLKIRVFASKISIFTNNESLIPEPPNTTKALITTTNAILEVSMQYLNWKWEIQKSGFFAFSAIFIGIDEIDNVTQPSQIAATITETTIEPWHFIATRCNMTWLQW